MTSSTGLHAAVDLESLVFPTLSEAEIDQLLARSACSRPSAGTRLLETGEVDFPLFVVIEGKIEILDESGDEPRHVTFHGPGEFTGDVDLLTRRPAVVTAVACEDCRVWRVEAEDLRTLMSELPWFSEKLLRAFELRRGLLESSGYAGLRIVGSAHEVEVTRMREFFYKNGVPHTWIDSASDEGRALLERHSQSASDLPLLISAGPRLLSKPSLAEVARCIGIRRETANRVHDLVVVGCGPAGLAAAVYGASEGLDTLVLDRMGPGGQAGTSSKIENFPGFPTGLSGTELATKCYLQALKFGAQFSAPVVVESMERAANGEFILCLDEDETVRTKTVLIATGIRYRRLGLPRESELEGAGVYYSATTVEARSCASEPVCVVGGGNSAGQAVMYLAQHASSVRLILRGGDLRKSMSEYLAGRIEAAPNIEIVLHSEVSALHGEDRLREITLRNRNSKEEAQSACGGLFIMVGGDPQIDWLPDEVARGERGYLLAGADVPDELWTEEREPCALETSLPGLFVAGDVRVGSTKRVAFAVGDGALAVTCVHRVLSGIA